MHTWHRSIKRKQWQELREYAILLPKEETMTSKKANQVQLSENNVQLLYDIRDVIQQARIQVQKTVNSAMVQTYWHIGRLIVEHEQQGASRAAYGAQQLEQLATSLTSELKLEPETETIP